MLNLSNLQLFVQKTKSLLGSYSWYPQVPLALASAFIGLLYLAPLLKNTIGWGFVSILLADDLWGIVNLNMWGVSQTAIGAFLLVMSLGVIGRSRLAWVTCAIVISIGILIQFSAAVEVTHWWRICFDSSFLLLLLPNYRRFDRHNIGFGTLFALTSLVVFMGYSVFGTYRLGEQFSPPITDLTSALYFMVVTITSVGYGDITPITQEARVFLISVIILGIAVISAAVGATLIPALLNRLENMTDRKKIIMKRSNHYIIVGHSALANNTYQELITRGEQVTVILQSASENSHFADIDVVIGDGSDVDTLKKAGGEEAKAILALLNDDSENAFVILAAKELESGIKTVAAVNNVKNMSRIRRVHPYLVIAPQVLGGELLTMALTGEKIDSSSILQRLMGQAKLASEAKPG